MADINFSNSNFVTPKNKLQSGLYIVSTPIGNLKDITFRALETLSNADFVLCEDTRVTERLISHYGIKAKLFTYNDHNAEKMRDKAFRWLEQGKSVALVSDAGTPLISDPGYKLAKEARQKAFNVTAIPGASAAIMGLTVSGLPTDEFHFCGFIKSKDSARENELEKLKHINTTLVFYERADRCEPFLESCLSVFGDKPAALTRELTKLFEEVITGSTSEVIKRISGKELKGEVVLLIHNAKDEGAGMDDAKKILREHMKTLSLKEAVDLTVEQTGGKKKQIYNLALEIKDEEA